MSTAARAWHRSPRQGTLPPTCLSLRATKLLQSGASLEQAEVSRGAMHPHCPACVQFCKHPARVHRCGACTCHTAMSAIYSVAHNRTGHACSSVQRSLYGMSSKGAQRPSKNRLRRPLRCGLDRHRVIAVVRFWLAPARTHQPRALPGWGLPAGGKTRAA